MLYNVSAKTLIPTIVKSLENPVLKELGSEGLIDKSMFEFGNEYNLLNFVLKKNLDINHKKQLQLYICMSSIRVLNKVSESIYSKKVMNTMAPAAA